MKKTNKLKRLLSGFYKKSMSLIFRLTAFIFLVIIAILIFTVNNVHWICLAGAALWTGYSMFNEFGKAMSLFSFFVVYLLGCIVINTERKNDN